MKKITLLLITLLFGLNSCKKERKFSQNIIYEELSADYIGCAGIYGQYQEYYLNFNEVFDKDTVNALRISYKSMESDSVQSFLIEKGLDWSQTSSVIQEINNTLSLNFSHLVYPSFNSWQYMEDCYFEVEFIRYGDIINLQGEETLYTHTSENFNLHQANKLDDTDFDFSVNHEVYSDNTSTLKLDFDQSISDSLVKIISVETHFTNSLNQILYAADFTLRFEDGEIVTSAWPPSPAYWSIAETTAENNRYSVIMENSNIYQTPVISVEGYYQECNGILAIDKNF